MKYDLLQNGFIGNTLNLLSDGWSYAGIKLQVTVLRGLVHEAIGHPTSIQ